MRCNSNRKLILRNEEYTGLRINNKNKKIPYSKKRVPTTEDKQYRKEDAQEPLVGKEEFQAAQLMVPKGKPQGRRKKAEPSSIFTGFIFCGHCHRALSRNTGKFICSVDWKVNREKIYWYDGVLEVQVKGEEYLGGEEPESLVNID